MLTFLKLEAVNDNLVDAWANRPRIDRSGDPPPRPWVARLDSVCSRYGWCRVFLDGKKNYRTANARGSRGVWIEFYLDEGVYQVQRLTAKGRPTRHYIAVENGKQREILEQEAVECVLVKSILALTSLKRRQAGLNGVSTDFPPCVLASLAGKIAQSCSTVLEKSRAAEGGD